MQEDVENKTFNLAVTTTKLIAGAIMSKGIKYLDQIATDKKNIKSKSSQGKQSVKQLLGQNQGVSTIDIAKTDLKDFQRVAAKYGIDYAIRKDASEIPPKYIVFFKAKDADAMTAAFKEYSANILKKKHNRKSVLSELHKAVAIAASLPQKAVDHVKNLHQDLSL